MAMVYLAIVVLAYIGICQAADKGYGEKCTKDDKCLKDTKCMQPSGCSSGQCACNSDQAHSGGNVCKNLVKIGEECKENNDCFDGGKSVNCTGSKCTCKAGLSPTENERACAKHVGDACSQNVNCNQGVTMECKDSKCACKSTYKEDDKMCVTYELGDDCSGNKKCIAGSCTDNKCSCANTLDAYLSKYCIKKNSKTDLGIGETCTANWGADNGKFCSKNLSCKKCPQENKTVCMSGASTIKISVAVLPVILALLRT